MLQRGCQRTWLQEVKMRHDVLADVLSIMKNMKDRGVFEIEVRPTSNVVKGVLQVLKNEGYISEFTMVEDKRGGTAKVKLTNLINNIGAIKPRFSVDLSEFEKFEARYLPAKDFGRLILSTSKGIITHLQAKHQKIGGILIAYVY
jgi:small subunit ribosomal protein S8